MPAIAVVHIALLRRGVVLPLGVVAVGVVVAVVVLPHGLHGVGGRAWRGGDKPLLTFI